MDNLKKSGLNLDKAAEVALQQTKGKNRKRLKDCKEKQKRRTMTQR